MESVIRYRHYSQDEAARFFGKGVFYSRSSHFRGNCPGLPDTIKVFLENSFDASSSAKSLTVVIELNQTGRTGELTELGFRKTAGGLYQKITQTRIKEGYRTIDVLARLHAALDRIVSELPILVYATAHAKQVRDYADFMLSVVPKLRQWELADFENCVVQNDITRFGLIDNHDISDFYVMRLPKGNWAAWIEGDELIPVLPDELQAYRFMKERLMLYEGFSRDAFEEFTGTKLGT